MVEVSRNKLLTHRDPGDGLPERELRKELPGPVAPRQRRDVLAITRDMQPVEGGNPLVLNVRIAELRVVALLAGSDIPELQESCALATDERPTIARKNK